MRRGVGIVEIAFVALAMAIALGAGAYALLHRGGQDGLADQRDVRAALAEARSLAGQTGNGATVAFTPASSTAYHRGRGFLARIYVGRPVGSGVGLAGAPQGGTSVVTDPAGGTTFSVFFSSSGSASYVDAWTPGSAYPGTGEPACSSSFAIRIRAQGESASAATQADRILTIDCETGDVSVPRRF